MAAIASDVGSGIELDVRIGLRGHFLLGDGGVGVSEHIGKSRNIFELRGEACADNVVRGSHAFYCVCAIISLILGKQVAGSP